MSTYYGDEQVTLHHGDALTVLGGLPAESVQCVVTSPPYWGLRDYGTATWDGGDAGCDHRHETEHQRPGQSSQRHGRANLEAQRNENFRHTCARCGAVRSDLQLGLEATPELYVERMVGIFREVWRVLRKDGTVWLNLGDAYASNAGTDRKPTTLAGPRVPAGWTNRAQPLRAGVVKGKRIPRGTGRWGGGSSYADGLKAKDLIGIPWMVAFALRGDGWWLRSEIIWAKPNPMPESAGDRPTKAHEQVFLLSKSARYYYDAVAIRERARWPEGPNSPQSIKSPYGQGYTERAGRVVPPPANWDITTGNGGHGKVLRNPSKGGERVLRPNAPTADPEWRNKRTVWEISTQPYPEAHFATFPEDLVKPCVLAGSRPRELVLDPFAGAGTTLLVAKELGRRAIGIELSADYCALVPPRLRQGVLAL